MLYKSRTKPERTHQSLGKTAETRWVRAGFQKHDQNLRIWSKTLMRIKASKGFMQKGSPHTARDSRSYNLVQREKGKYVLHSHAMLGNGMSSCLEALFSPIKEQTKEESTRNKAVHPKKTQQEGNKTSWLLVSPAARPWNSNSPTFQG